MAKQESVSDWMELAKIHDKLEKETIRPYVMICIQDGDTNKTLYKYDIPRQSFFEHNWIIRWRMSRIQCQYPRRRIIEVLSFYDKITGIELGFGSPITGYISAKAQITILKNRIAEYTERMKGDLFFDESTDLIIAKLNDKIKTQQDKMTNYEKEIKNKLNQLTLK